MDWSGQRTRIRRFLRDPNGNIWSDNLLLRLFNNEQFNIHNVLGLLDDVQVVRVPPMYQKSYLYDWEYFLSDHAIGYPYVALSYHDQSESVLCYTWEVEQLARSNATTGDPGTYYTQPWECWYVSTPGKPPPVWLPERFHEVKFIAYDKDPLTSTTQKEIQQSDSTWKSRQGTPVKYWRDEKLENHVVIYPIPSSVTWINITGEGMLVYDSEDTTDDETGTVIDAEASILSHLDGLAVDVFGAADNLLIVYSKSPKELVEDTDSSDFPNFMQKYIEYGTLEAAFKANTDGYSSSLSNFWGQRKLIAYAAIKKYKMKRMQDRDYQLQTLGTPAIRTRRRPRLPDAYPAQR